jgi:hypothetical protein
MLFFHDLLDMSKTNSRKSSSKIELKTVLIYKGSAFAWISIPKIRKAGAHGGHQFSFLSFLDYSKRRAHEK